MILFPGTPGRENGVSKVPYRWLIKIAKVSLHLSKMIFGILISLILYQSIEFRLAAKLQFRSRTR